jgi:hypothetical protein
MTRPANARTSFALNSSVEKRRATLISLAGLLVLTLAMFGDVLFAGGTRLLGHQGADLFLQYYSWREFGFGQLAKGNIPLWNPHIFSGAPYFGEMQGALLYPPNWLFLLLPLPAAINWTIALSVFGIGAFMFFWMRVRDLHPAAAFFAGATIMFSGPYFLHLFAGHLPQLAAMTWAALIFCAIDGLFKARKTGWCLLGIFAVAMQVLAGFPQYVFYTGIIAGLYSALRLVGQWDWRLAARLLAIYLGGAVLTAVQLLPAVEATRETVRGTPLPFDFAAMFSFPPENFLTLLAPSLFGPIASYWGRCYLWETSLFLGVTGFGLAVYAAIYVNRKTKWIPLTVIFAALLLALGVHTPLFRFLYDWMPGFDRFRTTAKFIFPACLFLLLLAATGLDRLFKLKKSEPAFVIGMFAAAAFLGGAALWVANTNSWQWLMHRMQAAGEVYLLPQLYSDAAFVAKSQHTAATSLFLSAAVCAVFGALLLFQKRDGRALFGLVALGILEVFWSAHNARPTFDSSSIVSPEEKSILDEHPGDYRIINVSNPNSAMSLGAFDIWGYDPDVVRRYAQFITWTQGGDPNEATLYVKFTKYDPLYTMLRLRYVFAWEAGKLEMAEAPISPMPHLQLVSNYRVLRDRDAIFNALRAQTFDPAREVILEQEPVPKPSPGGSTGTARIVKSSTDALTVEADVNQAAILLITDVYTPNWRAVSLPGSTQSKYELLPANYILRAVPLAAGHHRLLVEYAPPGFTVGKWISVAVAILFVVACGASLMRVTTTGRL